MKVRYIAIEREYGSAGRKIAEETAKKCGISCYGQEIMEMVALENNVPVKALAEYEESVAGNLNYSMFVMSQGQTGDPDLLSAEGKLYVAESRVIRNIAMKGPAVFIGHSAAKALENQSGVLRVFIHSDEESKRKRIIEDYGIPEKEVNSVCRKFNKKRANYYAFCTRKKWNDCKNYDVILDSSRLGIEGCVKVLTALCQEA